MCNSLSDQLLKAGLVSAGKAKKVRHEKKGAGKKGAPAESGSDEARRAAAEKAERDRELNRRREEERRQREQVAQLRQLIESNRLPTGEGEPYNFTDGGKVKRLIVGEALRLQLAQGRAGIVRLGEGYAAVSAEVVEKVRQRDAASVVALNVAQPKAEGGDDPYADYVVPDDLMW